MQETPWRKLKPPVKSKCGAIQSLKLEVDIKMPSSPTSCSKEPQLWGQTTHLSVFSSLFLKTCLPQYLIFFVNQFLLISFLSYPLYWFCSIWRLFTIYRCCRILPFGDDFAVTSCLWNNVHKHTNWFKKPPDPFHHQNGILCTKDKRQISGGSYWQNFTWSILTFAYVVRWQWVDEQERYFRDCKDNQLKDTVLTFLHIQNIWTDFSADLGRNLQ